MSNLLFDHSPDLSSFSATSSFKTLNSKFGDGYEQNTSVGINNRITQWQFTKTGKTQLINDIKAFFDLHKGAESFYWQSPEGLVRVKTGDYQLQRLGAGLARISTTFSQVFYP